MVLWSIETIVKQSTTIKYIGASSIGTKFYCNLLEWVVWYWFLDDRFFRVVWGMVLTLLASKDDAVYVVVNARLIN